MLINLGYQLCQIHEKLKIGKDNVFIPLVKILPRWVTPNYVTLFRFIVVLIWLPFALLKPSLEQVALFFILYFFDLLDGAIARFKNQITYLGKYFDAFSDRINHIALWIVIFALTDYQFMVIRFFVGWEILVAIFIVVEYFLKSNKLRHVRTLAQFCVKIGLWSILIYEVVQVYGG